MDGENLFDTFLIYFFKKNFMTIREKKIKAIYEKIARKDIDLWCKIKLKTGVINTAVWKPAWPLINCLFFRQIKTEDIGEIIGHPVMLGDVMEYFYGSVRFSEWWKCWRKLTKPVEEQSDGCINFIYSLISEQWEK